VIIAGVLLLILHWILTDAGVALPPVLFTLIYDFGIVLVVLGLILWALSFFGVGVGRGLGAGPRGRRYWW
jgi:hypothetical protein